MAGIPVKNGILILKTTPLISREKKMRAKTHGISFVIIISVTLFMLCGNSFAQAPTPDNLPEGSGRDPSRKQGPDAGSSATVPVTDLQKITLNGVKFLVDSKYQFFTWEELPPDLIIERMPVKEFTNPDGVTHYYEAVHYPKHGSINWHQGAYLAQDAGGYLACPTSEEENTFIFNLVNDRKFFHFFPPYQEGGRGGNHYEIGIGPWLGGYQIKGSPEPGEGWTWMSGEEMIYKNWAKDLEDGVIDRDPRDNTQPNNSGRSDQRTIGFGEMNIPVPTWGDYMDGTGNGGFVIEYESNPKR